jgi:hypothetical protein
MENARKREGVRVVVPNSPQIDKLAITVESDGAAIFVRTWWVSAAGVAGLGSYQEVNIAYEDFVADGFDMQGFMKGAYDAAKDDFTAAGGTLGSDEAGKRYGFLDDEA